MELVALIAHGLLGLSGDGLSRICMYTMLIILVMHVDSNGEEWWHFGVLILMVSAFHHLYNQISNTELIRLEFSEVVQDFT